MSEGRDLSLNREQIIGLLTELGQELDARGVKAQIPGRLTSGYAVPESPRGASDVGKLLPGGAVLMVAAAESASWKPLPGPR